MDYSELHAAIVGYYKAAVAKRKSKSGTAKQANSSLKLGGYTAAELQEQIDAAMLAHEQDTSNPHNDNASDLDMYTRSEFDSKVKGGMIQGLISASTYGDLSWLPIPALGTFTTASHVTTGNGRFLPMQLEDDGTVSFIRNGTDGSYQRACYGYIKGTTPHYTEMPYTLSNGKAAAVVYQGGQEVVTGALADDTQGFIALRNGSLDGTTHRFVLIPSAFLVRLAQAEVVITKTTAYIINLPNATTWMNLDQVPALAIYSIPLSEFNGTQYTPDAVSFAKQTSVSGSAGDASSVIYNVSKVVFSDSSDATECIWRSAGDDSLELIKSQWTEKGRVWSTSAYDAATDKINIQIQAPVRWYHNGTKHTDVAVVPLVFNVATTEIGPLNTYQPLTILSTGESVNGLKSVQSDAIVSDRGQESYYVSDANTLYVVSIDENIVVNRVTTANTGTLFSRLASPLGTGSSFVPITFPRYFGSPVGDNLCTFLPVDSNYAIVTTHNEDAESDHVLIKYNTSSSSSPMKNFTTVEGETNIGYTFGGSRARCITVGDKPSSSDLKPSISFVNGKDVGYYCAYFAPGVASTRATQYPNTLVASDHITIASSKLEAVMNESLTQAGYADADRKTYEVIVPNRTDVPPLIKVLACYSATGVNIMRVHTLSLSSKTGVVDTVTLGTVLYSNSISSDGVYGISESPYDRTGRLGRVAILGTTDGLLVHWVSNHLFSTRTTTTGREGTRRHECRFWLGTDTTLSEMTAGLYGENVPEDETFGVLPDQGFGAIKGIAYGTTLRFQLLCYGKSDLQKWTTLTSDSAKKWRTYTLAAQRTTTTSRFRITDSIPVIFRGRSFTVAPLNVDLASINKSFLSHKFILLLNYDFTTKNMEYAYDDSSPNSYRHLGIGSVTCDSRGPSVMAIYKPKRLDECYVAYMPSYTVASNEALGNFPNTKGDPAEPATTLWTRT